jgi:tetratricopeptide (TPR) repeat protein
VGLKLALGLALAREPEQRDEAVSLLSEALAEGTGDPGRVHLELGVLLVGLRRNEEAVAHLQEAVKLLPELPAAHYRLAEALRATGDAAGANRELERFEELSGERGTIARQVADLTAALQEVRELALQNRLSEALERVDGVLKDHPDEAQAHTLRAKVLSAQGSYSEALVSIVRARELAPDAAECHFLEGLFLVRLGEPAKGEAALLKAVELNAGLAQAHELLGTVAANADRHEEAVERFRKALAQGLDTPALRARLAESLRRLGRLEEAEQALAGAERR